MVDSGGRTILHVVQPNEGGAARVAAYLAADQVRRGWKVGIACPGHGPVTRWLEEAGAQHLRWQATREPGIRSFHESRRLGTIVRAFAPDIVHLHSSKAGLAGRLAVRGKRCTVFQPHAWSFEALRWLLRQAAVSWERFAARWSDAIVCVSEAERERGVRYGIHGPYRVVRNGVDLGSLRPAGPEEQAAARRRLGLGDGPLVVCAGRISRQKGQDLCLRAWPSVLNRVPDGRLVFVGDGPDRQALERGTGPTVRFVGAREDVAAWFAATDVVVAPSRWEGMSLTVLEAMAVGRSVVAFDAPGMRELLGDGAGAVVPVGDIRGLARALVDRLRDAELARREGGRGRRRTERSHDFAVTAQRIVDVYATALERRRLSAGGAGSAVT